MTPNDFIDDVFSVAFVFALVAYGILIVCLAHENG